MKKSTKITLISLAALAVLAGIGGTLMVKDDFNSRFEAFVKAKRDQQAKEAEKKQQEAKMTTKEKQLAYVKEHQQEIVDFIKRLRPKVETVQIDWSQTKWGESGLTSTTKKIYIYGKVNNIENSSWGMSIPEKDDGTLDLKKMGLFEDVRVGGEPLE